MNCSPAERACTGCEGHGRTRSSGWWDQCKECRGFGRVYLPGGPLFGCQIRLSDRKIGELVELGTGHRGRIVRHKTYGCPITQVRLIDDFLGCEEEELTNFPSEIGVRSVSSSNKVLDKHGDAKSREDHLDPLQRKKAL